ncbi:MAG: 16S rRNA (uracil(1498)-N(3))-methyltransferase [Thiohalocapsa sp.]|nr:16S rRNA (uracil(1498)-N(3))-methyltransferase [Thiohalocapsa sp.]
MRINRIYTPQALAVGSDLQLEPRASKHLVQVLRLGAGDEVVLFNGDGRDYPARIESSARGAAVVRVLGSGEPEPPPSIDITLALGISKGERMDLALQKAVELGVSSLVPLFTERSVVRLDAARLDKRMQHWQGIVIAACEQSHRRLLPTLGPAIRLDHWLAQWASQRPGAASGQAACGLMLDHRSTVAMPALPAPAGSAVTFLVGPEGGLSAGEREAAAACGFRGVRLGPRVMRTETAPLAAIAAAQALWGDFRG